jgi:Na+/proline symporter
MESLDWIMVALFLAGVVVVGLLYTRRASGSMEDYFVSGRNLPWWLAGTSILAASFSSDTPLHVTRVVRENGLGGAWFYWNGIFSGLVVAFFFAKLWRRAAIVTDAELIELRYSGRAAAVMRGVIAIFRSLVLELITLAWVILGMTKIARTVLGLPSTLELPGLGPVRTEVLVVIALVLISLFYSATSGLWGVVVVDFIEFIVAMGGAVLLAVMAMQRVGWLEGLRRGLAAQPIGEAALDFFPRAASLNLPTVALVTYLGFQWWAQAEIDGSGKRAQRFLACKNEANALASGIWNMAVQWILRNWPWYMTALASLVLYPGAGDAESIYPRMIAEVLPAGIKGLMVASLLAAFLSSVDTQLNLAASYAVNDIYRRFVVRAGSARHYVTASRLGVLMVAAVATGLALLIPSVLDAFRFKMELMAGLGLVYLLRWFWWRVTAWTEIAALGTGVLTTVAVHLWNPGSELGDAGAFGWRFIIVVGASALLALLVTLLGPREETSRLREFYRRVRPPAWGWGPIAALEPDIHDPAITLATGGQFGLALVAVFAAMFGIGKLLLGEPALGLGLTVVGALSGWAMLRWSFARR